MSYRGSTPPRHLPASWSMLCAAALGVLTGCGPVTTTIVAPHDEYAAYRQVRTSSKLEPRMQASADYLDRFPKGRWREEVRPWYQRAEAKYYEARRDNPVGLLEYLQVLPRGPHADEARRALDLHRRRSRDARQEELTTAAKFTEERLAAAAKARQHAHEEIATWLGSFFAITTWGGRTTDLDHEFIFRWRIDKPQGKCVEDRCFKVQELAFELPGGGDQSARVMVVDTVLVLDNGRLVETRLEGPALFNRLFEAAKAKPVAVDDRAARVAAISFVADFVAGAAESRMPANKCAKDAVAPVVLSRECDGWALKVTAAEDPAHDDVISVRGPAR